MKTLNSFYVRLLSSYRTALSTSLLVLCPAVGFSQNQQQALLMPMAEPSIMFGSDGRSMLDEMHFDLNNNAFMPGVQQVEIVVNNQSLGDKKLLFKLNPESQIVEPCISIADLRAFNINSNSHLVHQTQTTTPVANEACYFIEALLPSAEVYANASRYRLSLSIPADGLLTQSQ